MAGFWPDKREIALYVLLRKRLGKRFNLGDAIAVTKDYYPRRAAENIIKRLSKLGLLKRLGPYEYELEDLEVWVEKVVEEYLEARRRRYSSSSS